MGFATRVLSWGLGCSSLPPLMRPIIIACSFCGDQLSDPGPDAARFLIQILPASVVAPLYFQGKIGFGVINQSSSAFNHILSDVSLIVYQVGQLLRQTARIAVTSQRVLSQTSNNQQELPCSMLVAAMLYDHRPTLSVQACVPVAQLIIKLRANLNNWRNSASAV